MIRQSQIFSEDKSEKLCRNCERFKPLNQFNKYNGYYHSYCKLCRHGMQLSREWDKRKVIDSYKNQPCADCGNTYPAFVMQFDHRDPKEKKFSIGELGTRKSKKDLIEEIEKCDVVCANCHALRTYLWRSSTEWWTIRKEDSNAD